MLKNALFNWLEEVMWLFLTNQIVFVQLIVTN